MTNSPIASMESKPLETRLLELWTTLGSHNNRTRWAGALLHWLKACHQKGYAATPENLQQIIADKNQWPPLPEKKVSEEKPSEEKPSEEKKALSKGQALENYVDFLALLLPRYDRVIAHNWDKAICPINILLQRIQKWRKQRELTLASCFMPTPGIHYFKTWRQLTLIDKQEHTPALDKLLSNPDQYIAKGKMIKSGVSTTVAAAEVECSGEKKTFFVKRYNSKGLLYNVFRSAIPSRAHVTWHAAQLLRSIGIATASPIALLEKRRGPFKQESYVIHEFVDSIHGMRFFAEGATPNSLWDSIAEEIDSVLYTLKRSLIVHGDLKAHNFIISGDQVMLIDLDALQSYKTPISFSRAHQKDLARFEKNWQEEPLAKQIFNPILEHMRSEP